MTETKTPPHNIEAEESVIGSLLVDGETIRQVENTIKSADFYHEQCRWLFDSCLSLRLRREAINQVTLAQELQRNGRLQDCGGVAFLSHLVASCPTSLDIEYYADIVRRLSISRQMINLGGQIASIGYEANPETAETLDKISEMVVGFRKSNTVFDELISPKDAGNRMLDMITEYNQPSHVMSWGFKDLDELTSGIFPELIIFGARPSVGKTEILLNVMENVVKEGRKVLFASAEMNIKPILERKIARELRVDIRRLRKSGLDGDLMEKLADLAGVVSEQQVYYMPQGISSQDIYTEAVKMKENIGLDIVFVDYLQILRDCWQSGRESKVVLVGRASKVLKSIKDDLNIPVICASQLSREFERRTGENSRPKLIDLKESGEIEQDSDVVFLLWRDLDNEDEAERNILEVKMAKNRQLGDARHIKLAWSSEHHSYKDCFKIRELV